ncbi:hypothetical protein LINGRAHAP2_LOCUS29220 [Linum grandiflorum]
MMVEVFWPSPPPEWVALNSYESVIPETGQAVARDLFRDSDGRCLVAYSMNLGICSITIADLGATVQGLQREIFTVRHFKNF